MMACTVLRLCLLKRQYGKRRTKAYVIASIAPKIKYPRLFICFIVVTLRVVLPTTTQLDGYSETNHN
jgi:hypothetical protein